MTQTAKKIAKGDLAENKELKSIKTKDEVGILAETFSKMTNKLERSYKELKNLNENLEKKVEDRTKELQEQKETFEAIFKTSKDGIAILDAKTTDFLDCNEAYEELSGYPKEELLTKSCLELSLVEDREKSKKAVNEVIRVGFVKNFEKRCIKKRRQYHIYKHVPGIDER